MKTKATIILAILIFITAGIYIGIYISSVTPSPSITPSSVSENANTLPTEDKTTAILDLNTASAEDLAKIPGITAELADKIIAYRNKYDYFLDVDELLEIDGITDALYKKIKPYVTVKDQK